MTVVGIIQLYTRRRRHVQGTIGSGRRLQKKRVRNRFTTCLIHHIILFTFYCSRKRRNPNLCYNGPRHVTWVVINATRRYCRVVPKTNTLRSRLSWRHRTGYLISYAYNNLPAQNIYLPLWSKLLLLFIILAL